MADLYSNSDAAAIIEDDGLAYAVRHYCSGDCFRDPDTARLWTASADALDALVKHLERQLGRDDIG